MAWAMGEDSTTDLCTLAAGTWLFFFSLLLGKKKEFFLGRQAHGPTDDAPGRRGNL